MKTIVLVLAALFALFFVGRSALATHRAAYLAGVEAGAAQGYMAASSLEGPITSDYLGATWCAFDGKPISMINRRILNTPEEEEVALHEDVHFEQLQRKPTCFLSALDIDRDLLEAEAEAWCSTINHMIHKRKLPTDSVWNNVTHWLSAYPSPPISQDSARVRLKKFC